MTPAAQTRRDDRPRRAIAGGVLWLLLIVAVSACAPVVVPPGPMVQPPAMGDDRLTMADGARLPLHRWSPDAGEPRAVVVALHGFNDYGAFFDGLGGFLAANGIAAYAYDQRGFGRAPHPGRWAGADGYLDDLRHAIGLIRNRHPGLPVYVFGESMGGAVAMAAAAEPPGLDADGLILAAPAVWARETMPFYQRWPLAFGAHVVPWLRVSARGLKITPSDNVEMLRALGRDPLVIKETRIDAIWGLVNLMDRALESSRALPPNTLILYGASDEVIRKDPTRAMLARLRPEPDRRPSIAIYEDGYHMLIRDLAAETVWRDVRAWIDGPDKPLPSGAERAGRDFITEARQK